MANEEEAQKLLVRLRTTMGISPGITPLHVISLRLHIHSIKYLGMNRQAKKQKLAKNVKEIYGILLPSHTKEIRAKSFAGKSRTAEMAKLTNRPPDGIRLCQLRAMPYNMKELTNQLKYMINVFILSLGYFMISKNVPFLKYFDMIRTLFN